MKESTLMLLGVSVKAEMAEREEYDVPELVDFHYIHIRLSFPGVPIVAKVAQEMQSTIVCEN